MMELLNEEHRCRCGRQVPFHALAECSCNSKWKYCTRCHVEGCGKKFCPQHSTCWGRHLLLEDGWADTPVDHKPLDPKGQLFSRTIIYSESDDEKVGRLHDDDKVARWFNIKHEDGNPKLCLYDRFGTLLDRTRSGNTETTNLYPGFVSFIGKSGVGKSTLVKAMILLGAIDDAGLLADESRSENLEEFARILSSPHEVPVTKSGSLKDLTDPTTSGVHLYKDGQGLHSEKKESFPILFADCEGFYAGNALPNSERYAEHESEGARTLQRHLLYEAEITSSAYKTQDKRGVELFYARFLYAVSDVVVFVTNDDNLVEHSITSILEWAATAVLNSVNHPSRKTLIIVRHMANDPRPELYKDDVLWRVYLNQKRKIWKGSKVLEKFVADYNSKQDFTGYISENQQLYRVLFSDISCCCIPNKNNVDCKPETLFGQYRDLRRKIDDASHRARSLRNTAWTQYNVPTLSSILLKAFEHFRVSDEAFDFYVAARNDNPTPRGFSDHIANFLRIASETTPESSMVQNEIQEMTQRTIALSFIIWAMRNFDHWVDPKEVFDRGDGRHDSLSLEKTCEIAFKQYEAGYQRCYFTFANGERCIIRPASTHDHHQSANGQRTQGNLVPRYHYSMEWVRGIRECFIKQYQALVTNDGLDAWPTGKLLRHMDSSRRELYLERNYQQWRQIRSNKTCLACLQQVPENVLQCGHAYCVLCVQELGTKSEQWESAWVIDHCSLCWANQNNSHLVRMKPKCAGARILTLDGGGVRGVIELTLVKNLNEKTGLGIHFREFFDLIVGTSTGGIIALALAMEEKPLEVMTKDFVEFATATFSRPNAGDLLTKMKIGHVVTKMFMALGFTRTMFNSAPLKEGLIQFFGERTRLFSMARERQHQCSTRVAVVAATNAGDTKCLIPSYNRPDLSDCSDFEREDDDNNGMKIWEAALATSAAPFYLPAFKKEETKKEYVDGALYANCPAETALREMKKLWPQNGASLDVLLSLGTGKQKKEIKIPKTIRIGGFEEICRSFHNNLDTQKLWERFLQTDAAEATRGRLHRLNPAIKPDLGYVSIFQYEKMSALQTMVEERMSDSEFVQEVQDIADVLLANLFFFEPDDEILNGLAGLSIGGTTVLKGNIKLPGTIRSRLRHKSVELKTLLSKVLGFAYALLPEHHPTHMNELPSELRWIEVQSFQDMRAEIEDNKCQFRIPVSMKGSKESPAPHVFAVRMKERPGRWIPISGFPVCMAELLRRAGSRG